MSDSSRASSGSVADSSSGFFSTALSFLLSNPRRDEREKPGSECSSDTDYTGRSLPYHSLPIDNGNDFNTTNEAFQTSSPDAQTPYVTYASWDPCHMYFGMTGSAVGAGDCEGGDCPVIDRAESPYRYWMLYLNTDPQGTAGSVQPRSNGPTPERLPFRADYLIEIRLDGVTSQTGDGYTYQGNAQLYSRTSDWSVGLEESWAPQGRSGIDIGDNSSSNFIEVAIDRGALGNPCAVEVVGWVADTRADTAFAYWPPPRGFQPNGHTAALFNPNPTSSSTQTGSARTPSDRNSSQTGSTQTDTTTRATPRFATTEPDPTTLDSVEVSTPRLAMSDSLVLDVHGFVLTSGQQPNASGNLNRTDYSQAEPGCTGSERS
ncbi:hypothetical protein [Rubrivirga sp.]|uniref:hypothetical protein n=1 Tax=Rubrivirga sp. TaxID=1885344 RepID=UPI003C72B0C2